MQWADRTRKRKLRELMISSIDVDAFEFRHGSWRLQFSNGEVFESDEHECVSTYKLAAGQEAEMFRTVATVSRQVGYKRL